MHLRYVCLFRWDSLRANASAMKFPWPLSDTLAQEFEVWERDYNASVPPSHSRWPNTPLAITEYRMDPARCGGNYPCWTSMTVSLSQFRAEILGN